MTTLGHSLMGLSIAAVALPRRMSLPGRIVAAGAFVALACAPDIPLRGWGHHAYRVSHSIFVTGAITAAIIVAARLAPALKRRLPWPLLIGGAACWVSHLLLDCFYNHGIGMALLWPFSRARLNLAMPWFYVNVGPPKSPPTAVIHAIELGFYGSVLIVCLLLRRLCARTKVDVKPSA